MFKKNKPKKAFTLLELAVSFIILGLLLATTLPWVQWQWQHQAYLENAEKLAVIEQSIYGFIKQNGKIPCPSALTNSDGLEQKDNLGNCLNSWGILPWQSLGVPSTDRFGHLYHYQVDNPATPSLKIQTRNLTLPHPLIDEFQPLAIVISHGAKNNGGDEITNLQEKTNNQSIKVSRLWQPQQNASCNDEIGALCAFDDQIIAISTARFWFYKPSY